jgi:hypothetical protein
MSHPARAVALAALACCATGCASSPTLPEPACPQGWTASGGGCVAECRTNLTAAIVDRWGTAWDAVERPATTMQAARTSCRALGGRLPTVTELYRVSAARTGAVGDAASTNELWSLTPLDQTGGAGATAEPPLMGHSVRLSDGVATQRAMSAPATFRCVCPPARPAGFTGGSCFGPPGVECFPFSGGKLNADRESRPALALPAAIFECAASGGELPGSERLVAAIAEGLPLSGGLANRLLTADVVSVRGNNVDAFDTVAGNLTADPGIVGSMEWRFWSVPDAFRCVGRAVGYDPPAVPAIFKASRGGRAIGLDPQPIATTYSEAVAECWRRGGQLPTAGELASFVMQGLPARATTGRRLTSDQVWRGDDRGLVAAIAWQGEMHWDVDPALATTTADRDGMDLGRVDGAYTSGLVNNWKINDALPYHCTYAAVDPSVVAPTDSVCQNEPCLRVVSGNGRVWFWMDQVDRRAVSFPDAVRTCNRMGARLPSGRELLLAIRAGLSAPTDNSAVLTSERVGQGNVKVISWTGSSNPGFVDASGYEASTGWDAMLAPTNAYRCMWSNEVR